MEELTVSLVSTPIWRFRSDFLRLTCNYVDILYFCASAKYSYFKNCWCQVLGGEGYMRRLLSTNSFSVLIPESLQVADQLN